MTGVRRWLAVEALALGRPLTGVGRYTAHLLKVLMEEVPDLGLDLLVLGHKELDLSLLRDADVDLNRLVVHRRETVSPRAYRLAVATGVAPRLERVFPVARRAAAILYPNFVRYPTGQRLPELVIVYDATFKIHPEDKSWWFRIGWSRLTQQALDSPATCASISRSAAQDIGRQFRVSEPLEVLYPGLDGAPRPRRLGSSGHVLVVGTSTPRKNIALVYAAHQLTDPTRRPPLVVVGMGHPERPGIDVRGYVTDQELVDLLDRAAAVVAPSRNEGFDLPVTEALVAGIPVIASDIPVHREVLGDGWPLLFDPDDPTDLAALLERAKDLPPTPPVDLGRFDWGRSAGQVKEMLRL